MMIGCMHLIKVDKPRVKTAELLTVNSRYFVDTECASVQIKVDISY